MHLIKHFELVDTLIIFLKTSSEVMTTTVSLKETPLNQGIPEKKNYSCIIKDA